jgi:SPP1 gp7 family putative phage head morphogenesis protein
VQYEGDLREAARLGSELGLQLQQLAGLPPAAVPFTGADPAAIRASATNVSALIRGEGVRFRDQLVQIVGEGATRGWGPKRLEKQIRVALQGAKDPDGITRRLGLQQRASLIARSELAAVYAQGSLTRARERGDAYVRVLASNDERTCPICAARNGRVYPVDRVLLPFHPRCVLGDTHVSPGLLAAAFRSRYRGNVVTVGLANGERLTVTIDHPVLTPAGWIKAETLRKGDQLLGHGLNLAMAPGAESPDLHEVPATAEQVFTAFSQACSVSSVAMPASALDLHGDGQFIEGDIEVVRANGFLYGHWVTERGDGSSNGDGIGRSIRFSPFTSFRDADGALLWHAATANGSMSRADEALAILGGGLSHAEQHRLASVAWRDPVLAQERRDGAPLNAERCGNGLDAAAPLEHLQRRGLVVDGSVAGETDAGLPEVAIDDILRDADSQGDVLCAHPGLVELHEVVSVEINPFHGFVYTFETFCGAYAMGERVRVASRNCRCVPVPVPNEAVQERDPAVRAVLLDNDRWQEEHERGVEAYAEGQHQQRLDGLRRQERRLTDPDLKDAMAAKIARLVERGPDMVKARLELSRALRTPTASEKRLLGPGAQSLAESVALFG